MNELDNPDLQPSQIYYNYAVPLPPQPPIVTNTETNVTVTNINGASGPNINFTSSDGFAFAGSAGGTVVFSVSNAATARAALSAAKSGVNSDITAFTALTGNTGVHPWTGTADGTGHATYSGTASAAYVQAELQGVMDKLKETTEFIMFLVAALLAPGVVET